MDAHRNLNRLKLESNVPAYTFSDAIEFLNAIIEHHNDIQLRVESVEILDKLAFNDKSVFNILENIIVSDDNVDFSLSITHFITVLQSFVKFFTNHKSLL